MEFADDYDAYVNRLIHQLADVMSNIYLIIEMDSFKGESADKAKESLSAFHIKMLGNFESLIIDLLDNVDTHIDTFLSEVDSDQATIIESNYLDEHDELIQDDFMNMVRLSSAVKQTINSVADISSATAPSFSSLMEDKAATSKTIIHLNDNLSSFVSTGKGRINNIQETMNDMRSLLNKASQQSDKGKLVTTNKIIEKSAGISNVLRGLAQTRTFYTSGKVINASNNGNVISTVEHTDSKTGKISYRVKVNRGALEALGVNPDIGNNSDFNHRLPKNRKKWGGPDAFRAQKNQTILKGADSRGLFKSSWTDTGKNVLKMAPDLKYFREDINIKHVASSALKGAGKGIVTSFTDTFTFFKKNQSKLSRFSKGLGVAGIGLSYYTNYNDATEDGLSGGEASSRARKDTAIDTGVGGAVQMAFTAAGTALIPIPGVGTAVGALAGIGANWALNKDWNGNGKTIMDSVKGWFR
ncbi:T7SS effector LXG polymorphic toxin [Salipaludibacillus sp. HK11]|uniref:T7SS effector LXG polymorphic toxin n=1 Tax=Salipaludibacillus sp. HK11 TaxID=3394320 RepID=UPI0039FCC5AD